MPVVLAEGGSVNINISEKAEEKVVKIVGNVVSSASLANSPNKSAASDIKMQLLSNMPGELHIRMANLSNLSKDYVEFAPYVYDAIKLLNGINDIQVNFTTGEVVILYSQVLRPEQIIRWINIIIDTAIDYMDFIAAKWESDRQQVIQTLNQTLINKLQKVY